VEQEFKDMQNIINGRNTLLDLERLRTFMKESTKHIPIESPDQQRSRLVASYKQTFPELPDKNYPPEIIEIYNRVMVNGVSFAEDT